MFGLLSLSVVGCGADDGGRGAPGPALVRVAQARDGGRTDVWTTVGEVVALEQAELAHRVKLLEALKELTLNEEGTQYLDEDHRATLEAEEALAQHQENAKHVLQFLREIARKLFVDWNILRGVNVKHRLAELDRALEEGALEGLRAMLLADR